MGVREELFVSEVAQADTASTVAGLLIPPEWFPSHVVTAGPYSITYHYQTEMRFGPALYTVTIVGPKRKCSFDTAREVPGRCPQVAVSRKPWVVCVRRMAR